MDRGGLCVCWQICKRSAPARRSRGEKLGGGRVKTGRSQGLMSETYFGICNLARLRCGRNTVKESQGACGINSVLRLEVNQSKMVSCRSQTAG